MGASIGISKPGEMGNTGAREREREMRGVMNSGQVGQIRRWEETQTAADERHGRNGVAGWGRVLLLPYSHTASTAVSCT